MEAIQSELILLSLLYRALELRPDICARCNIFVCAVIILLDFNYIVILIVTDVCTAPSTNNLLNELSLLPKFVILLFHHVIFILLLVFLGFDPL